MGFMFVPVAISMMSPFALATGLPSLVLLHIWFLKLNGIKAWSPYQETPGQNQVEPIDAKEGPEIQLTAVNVNEAPSKEVGGAPGPEAARK